MHPHRTTTSFITVIGMACCLVLGGLASPAAAKPIVVTTLTDIADPPFDADGPCGTGTIKDLPGADGLVSLREAIIAANNTPGSDTITFLSGGIIVVNFDDVDGNANPDPLPALCGGQTFIQGDFNGDDTPISHCDVRSSLYGALCGDGRKKLLTPGCGFLPDHVRLYSCGLFLLEFHQHMHPEKEPYGRTQAPHAGDPNSQWCADVGCERPGK